LKSFGKATYVASQKAWKLDLEPHVAMRAKQVFQKIRKASKVLYLSATEENCRDLEWFLQRYPLDVSHPDILVTKAQEFDQRATKTWQILQGHSVPKISGMALPPRPYQAQAAQLCFNTKGLLLADDLGLGKTVSAIALLALEGTLPALVVVPTHLQTHWKQQLKKFLPELKTHIIKKTAPYSLEEDTAVVISTYHKLSGWVDVFSKLFKTVVFDECQELRREGSLKYEAADTIAASATWLLGLSATPIYNYGVEYWNVLNILSQGALGTKEEFLREWCRRSSNTDKSQIGDPKAFGMYLRETGIMLRRTKADVGRELPPITRIVEEVDSDSSALSEAKDAASELAAIILSQESKKEDRFSAAGQFDSKMRQITGLAKAPFVAEFIRMIVDQSGPVVVFGWHRDVYSIWCEKLKNLNPVLFTGSETPVQKQRNLESFLQGDSKVLLMSLRSGSGVDGLQHVTSNVIIGELDWSPEAIEQCVGRVLRDGQREPVFAYYLIARDGADPIMVDVLGVKRQQAEGVRDPHAKLLSTGKANPEHIKQLATAYLKSRKK